MRKSERVYNRFMRKESARTETPLHEKLPRLITPLPGPKAKRVVDLDQRHISPSYTRSYPLVARRGLGAMVEDVDGNTFLDFNAGIAVVGGGVNEQGFLGGLAKALDAVVYSKFVKQKMGMMMANSNQNDLALLADMVQSGKLKTVIDRTYKLADAAEAVRYLEEGHARGKVIITVD